MFFFLFVLFSQHPGMHTDLETEPCVSEGGGGGGGGL